jgi:hypothetical protein
VTHETTIDKSLFSLQGDLDDLRVDRLCQVLLKRCYDHLVAGGMSPEEATRLASGADYFVRDYLLDSRRESVFCETPGMVRRFAGNWYIVNTLEPNLAELATMLQGIASFYRFLAAEGLIDDEHLARIEAECAATDYYGGRIDSFWQITGDGYPEWERECSLKQ